MMSDIWKHVRTGGLYTVMLRDVINEADMKRLIIYRSLVDGKLWSRPETEFLDGRFHNLSIEEAMQAWSKA